MTAELDILKIVADNPNISQRKIAEQTGISLGQVNFLIKKFAKKGLIKIEGQTSKTIRYNLTPKGFAEKAVRTLQYIKISYNAVIAVASRIRGLTDKFISEGYKVYVYGSQGEMMEVVKLAIDGNAIYINDISEMEIELIGRNQEKSVVFYWEADKAKDLLNLVSINILE